MLWQAESGFWFRMAEGNLGRDNLPETFYANTTVAELAFKFIDPNIRPSMKELLAYARSHDVDRFVSVVIHAYPDGTQMHAVGSLQTLGGVYVSPACGYTSLTGDRRLVTPGQTDLGGRAALTAILASRSSLQRAHTLLGKANGPRLAERILAQTYPVLKLLQSYDPTSPPLSSAVELVARGQSELASPESGQAGREAMRSAGEWIRKGDRALGAYMDVINPGVAR